MYSGLEGKGPCLYFRSSGLLGSVSGIWGGLLLPSCGIYFGQLPLCLFCKWISCKIWFKNRFQCFTKPLNRQWFTVPRGWSCSQNPVSQAPNLGRQCRGWAEGSEGFVEAERHQCLAAFCLCCCIYCRPCWAFSVASATVGQNTPPAETLG